MQNTKLKVKEEDTSFIDYGKLKKENKRLENEKKGIVASINAQNKKLSDLVDNEIKITTSNDKLVFAAKEEAVKIIDEAKAKRKKATELQTQASEKISKAEVAKKESDDLIKSNQGKEDNLIKENKVVKALKEKLIKILEMIRDVL